MTILYLSSFVPFPLRGGGCMRLQDMVSATVKDHRVLFASISREPALREVWPLAGHFAEQPVLVQIADHPGHADEVKSATPKWHLAPLGVARVNSRDSWMALARLPLQQVDIVHIIGSGLMPYGLAIKARFPRVRLVVDLHRVDWHARARAIASERRWWLRRSGWRSALEWIKWYLYERRVLPLADKVLVCSELDGRRVSKWVPPSRLEVVPNAVTVGPSPPAEEPADSHDLVFTGAMLFGPNIEAACYFVRDVWPRVRAAVPQATFWIVGKDPSEAVRRLHNPAIGVIVTGEVPEVLPYLQRSVAAVVPLRNGGGTRLKILEAMAAGRAVVSTSVGAEGLDVTTGDNILIGDDPPALAAHCISVLTDPALRHRVAAAGRELVQAHYDSRVLQARLSACYESLGAASRSAGLG